MSEALSSEQLDRFADLMNELINLQVEMNAVVSTKTMLTADERAGLKDKISEWLRKVQQIANELGPKNFTVGAEIGFPPKVTVSFTW